METFSSILILFFLVMDPLGNLPVFITTLENLPPKRYGAVVLRESLIALGVLLLFFFCGGKILEFFHISKASLELSGGIILFLIAIKLIFSTPAEQMQRQNNPAHEPFIVPLAIPLFAGPGSMSTAILLGGKSGSLFAEALALICAWSICTLILLSGRYAGKFLGTKVLAAMESLMGLLLTTMALEMIISGIKQAFHLT
ncbi:MAG: MarC family protein [Victivallales bacterium]|nr:MarC family protein [bacterium]MDD7751352.1 MarC family protein [bacterium]MDY5697622.1 MarC family protein [Victivallales bacterium]